MTGITEGPTVLIVGSGPTGATYARTLVETIPTVRVLMIEAGPMITAVPGINVKNLSDPEEQAAARSASQGPETVSAGVSGIPGGVIVEGTITARQGTHLVGQPAPGSDGMPAVAVSTCVGGQGAHWTCSTPRPIGSERIDFIDSSEWDRHITDAERLLHVTAQAFGESPRANAVLHAVQREFAEEDLQVRPLPVAADVREDGSLRWSGTDVVLGPLADPATRTDRFQLRSDTLCVRLVMQGRRVTGAVLRALPSGNEEVVAADAVVVAADAFHTPQLLWMSGIRPPALGRYLTEHPLLFGVVSVREGVLPAAANETGPASVDPIRGAVSIPFKEGVHPFSAQFMYTANCPAPLTPDDPHYNNPYGYVAVGYGLRKYPRREDRVTFDESESDYYGRPQINIAYALTDREHAEINLAYEFQTRAANALGEFVTGTRRVMPAGTSLHIMGTYRIGPVDDGTCVCDSWSRVWGVDGLVLAGNGTIPTANSCNPTLTSVAIALRGAAALGSALSYAGNGASAPSAEPAGLNQATK